MHRLLTPLALLMMAPGAAFARSAASGGYAVELVDTSGRPLPTYYHRGTTYVLGAYGSRYDVRVVNRSGQRVEAVITVDGRDAISGDPGNYQQRGYIIDPYGSVTVEGFRQSHDRVAAFRFTDPGDSYAGRRGSTRNVGVIGVALFKERARPVRHRVPIARRDRRYRPAPTARPGDDALGAGGVAEAEMAPRKSSGGRAAPAPRAQNLGTRYGESMHSSVIEVPFRRRSSRPDRVLSLYYDDYAGLQAKGVVPRPPHYYSGTPDPFPADRRFAPPPN